jgi:hypothetical protein
MFGVFRVKNHDFTPKIIFFPILGGRAPGAPPSGSAPAYIYSLVSYLFIKQDQMIFTCNSAVASMMLSRFFNYNIVSNISCRFLCKIKMQYLSIFLLIFLYKYTWKVEYFLLKVWYALERFRVKLFARKQTRNKQDGGITLNTSCKEIWWNVIVTDWNIWYYVIKDFCTNVEEYCPQY